MGKAPDPRLQNRHILFVEVHGRRSVAARPRGRSRGMVSDRQSDIERQLPSGKDDYPKSQGADLRIIGRTHEEALDLCFLCLLCFCVPLCSGSTHLRRKPDSRARCGDRIYASTIKNPTSHLYDIEISIKGIRDTSVSVSMPAWSPGMYRIENYARNVRTSAHRTPQPDR